MKYNEALDRLARGKDKWFTSVNDKPPTWMMVIDGCLEPYAGGSRIRAVIPVGSEEDGSWCIDEGAWRSKRIELGLEKKVEEEAVVFDVQEDTGAHYRYSHRAKVSQADADRGYVDVKLDPYRICSIYQTGGGPREHIVKKGLRGLRKGDTEMGLIKQLRDALARWEEMVKEDGL